MAASRWTATKAPSIRSARRRKARQAATAGPSGMSMTAKALSALIVCATRIAPTSMPDTRLGDLPEDVRVYLRPTGFIDAPFGHDGKALDRKSTRLELQSLMRISYAVFCLK